MIAANRDIILLNKRYDKASRRDMYRATKISGVSYHHGYQSTKDSGYHKRVEMYKIRIPLDAQVQGSRTYLPEAYYDALDDAEVGNHWSLHTEDMIIVCLPETDVPDTALDEKQVKELTASVGAERKIIHIVDYADNTLRGSDTVKHWRIGGA